MKLGVWRGLTYVLVFWCSTYISKVNFETDEHGAIFSGLCIILYFLGLGDDD